MGGSITFGSYWMYVALKQIRQTEIHTAESFVSRPSSFEAPTAGGKLNRYQLPATD
jgi:hypothetical protein